MTDYPLAGQILTHWNMPCLLAGKLIERATGAPCHHCAVVLKGGCVWEAWMPKVHYTPWPGYEDQCRTWASSWKLRATGKTLTVNVWEHPNLPPTSLALMQSEAVRWLGHRYSMVVNWIRQGDGIHCSEFVARVLMAGELECWLKEPSRISPIVIEESLIFNGWRLVAELTWG